MRNWFGNLWGFKEISPENVRKKLTVGGTRLTSRVNGKSFECGTLEISTLNELRGRINAISSLGGKLRVTETVSDATALHRDPANAGASFQVASQFNLLEMTSPNVTPEQGVGIYSSDPTQGPACAIACGAGTVYRNYFVPLDGQIGQTANKQVDCVAGIGEALGNSDGSLWEMRNGYLLPTRDGLGRISNKLKFMTEDGLNELRGQLQIGLQKNTQVTLGDCKHDVTQLYCSALPVLYCNFANSDWKPFAQLVLDASYEATFCAAIANAVQTDNKSLYLTLLGGGAFGNEDDWIFSAIRRSLELFRSHALDVRIVSYRHSKSDVQQLVARFS